MTALHVLPHKASHPSDHTPGDALIFDEQQFKERDPETYSLVLLRYARIDTAAWQGDRPGEFEVARRAYATPRQAAAKAR